MTVLVDSDIAMSYLKGHSDTVRLFEELRRTEISISVLSIAELVDGIAYGPYPAAAEFGLARLTRGLRVRVVNRAIGERTGRLRADLRRKKRAVGHRSYDLVIAATAIEHGLALVTRNLKDFRDIPDLLIYPIDTETI